MNAIEARKMLAPPLIFGDEKQIRARKTLERILIAKEIISQCSMFEHFSFTFVRRREDKVEHLENFEEEVLSCEECSEKIKDADGLHIDELLAAIAELFDEWWVR